MRVRSIRRMAPRMRMMDAKPRIGPKQHHEFHDLLKRGIEIFVLATAISAVFVWP